MNTLTTRQQNRAAKAAHRAANRASCAASEAAIAAIRLLADGSQYEPATIAARVLVGRLTVESARTTVRQQEADYGFDSRWDNFPIAPAWGWMEELQKLRATEGGRELARRQWRAAA